MLTPPQVIPFLQHDDPDIREEALRYLCEAHDPSPATAEDSWRVIDRFGLAESLSFVARLHNLPQSHDSLDRTLRTLREGAEGGIAFHLQNVILWMDLELLDPRQDELLSSPLLNPDVREHLAQRLALTSRDPAELWEELSNFGEDVRECYANEFDLNIPDRLAEALARSAEGVDRVVTRLQERSADDWMEIFCVRIIGRARHALAVPLLIDRLKLDADVLREDAVRALVRIGSVEVVRRLEAFYPGKAWHTRLYISDALGKIKRPESEAALIRLIGRERPGKREVYGVLAGNLCGLWTTQGLEAVRQVIVRGQFDPQIEELDQRLLILGRAIGYEPPEAEHWRATIAERRREAKRRARLLQKLLGWVDPGSDLLEMRAGWREDGDGSDDLNDPDEPADELCDLREALPLIARLADAFDQDPDCAVPPIHRQAAKVGRNEMCPCGSGKKYKKCCLRGG